MDEYETLDAVVVKGGQITDMDDWLVQPRKKRRATEVKSEPLENTQTTDTSYRSQSSPGDSKVSDAASDIWAEVEYSDDYTGEDEESENEERSVDTRIGLPDSQLTDGTYDEQKEKKKRRKKAKKAANKAKGDKDENKGHKVKSKRWSPPGSPSY